MGLFHKEKKHKEEDNPETSQTNSFSDIMNGLQYAVNCAQDTLQSHQIQNLTKLLAANEKGVNSFHYERIRVGDKVVNIPLIALVSHHYLAMDNVQISFKAKVGSVTSQVSANDRALLSIPDRANLQMQMSNIKPEENDVMEVSVNFKVQETPESISRIIDDFVKDI